MVCNKEVIFQRFHVGFSDEISIVFEKRRSLVFLAEWTYKTCRNRSSESGYVVDDGRSDGH